jgi:O-antigen ligase
MAANSAALRHHDAIPTHSWLFVGVAMLALAVGCGYTIAQGELIGLYVAISLVAAVAVLFDFRVGAVLLALMLPVSPSELFPRTMLGIAGLNPLNLLLAATVASYVISGRLRPAGPALPRQVLWLYLVPLAVAAFIGMPHVREIPAFFYDTGSIQFTNERQYLIVTFLKMVVIVAIALMVGAAVARSQKPERFIIAIAVSAWLIALVQLGFVIIEGVPLAAMATPGARSFYEPIGMHANTLGRVHLGALALLLFVWSDSREPRMRLFLLVTLAVVSMALVLTFSRASIAAAGLVGALFLMWKFNLRNLGLALIGLLLVALVAGEALYSRATLGFGESADAVSAGRIEGIWLPLVPELWKSPLLGNGLSSIMWSFPMVNGAMLPVAHPHNAYLEALLDMGIVGLILLLAYFAHVWRGFRVLGRDATLSPELRALFQGATALLCAFFVTGLAGGSLKPEADSAYVWLAIGCMYGMLARRPAR